MNSFKDLGIETQSACLVGEKIKIAKILNRNIIITNFRIEASKFPKNKSMKCLHLEIEVDNERKIVFTGSDVLISTIEKVRKEDLPIFCQIVQEGEHFEFK